MVLVCVLDKPAVEFDIEGVVEFVAFVEATSSSWVWVDFVNLYGECGAALVVERNIARLHFKD